MPPMMIPQMGPPSKNTWEELAEQLKVTIENREMDLLLQKAQLKEAESHLNKKK